MSDVIEMNPKERDVCAKCGELEPFGPPLLIKAEGRYFGINLCHGCSITHASNVSERQLDAIEKLTDKLRE